MVRCIAHLFTQDAEGQSAGGPGHCVFASFTSVLLVIGGSGISFALATIQELMQQDEQGKSRVSHIELVWSVRDPGKQCD